MKTMYLLMIIISTLTVTLQLNASWNKIRLLDSNDNLEKACIGIVNDYEDLKNFDSLEQYVTSLNLKASAGRQFLLDLIIDQSFDGIADFISELSIYLVMLVLAAIVLISWPFMCLCCCCSCCCFKKERKKGTCGLVNFIIALVCISTIVLISIAGLSQTGSFVSGFNGSLCSLLTFFDTAIAGEKTDDIPRWGGAQGISTSFTTSINLINILQTKSIILPSVGTKSEENSYINEIDTLKVIPKSINDPTDSSLSTPPVYKHKLEDENDSTSLISQINKEKELIIDNTMKVLKQLETLLTNIKTDTGMVDGLQAVQSLLGGFQHLVESLSNKVADNIVDLQTIVSSIILTIFFIIYGLFLAISVSSLSLLLVYMLCKCYCLRYFIHVMWNLMFLLTILSFIVGCLFGILGIVGHQFVPVINHIFSSAFLNSPDSPFGSQGSTNLLETCINGDGDLAVAMNLNPTTGATANLNKLIQLSVQIDKIRSSLDSVSDSTALPLAENKMKDYLTDIDSTSSKYRAALDAINTDYRVCFPNASPNTFWVSGQSVGDIEITSSQPSTTYSCGTSIPSININDKIRFVKDSIESNEIIIGDVITQLSKLKPIYKKLLEEIQKDLTTATTNTVALVLAFGHIIGDNTLYSMFNCRFMRYELINFIDQLGNRFSRSSEGIGICCLICSFASYIGVFFIMNSIYYYSKQAREQDSKEDEEKPQAVQNAPESQRDNNPKDQTSIYKTIKPEE